MPCYHSAYRQAIKDYCVEIVNDLGFDGIWFDGTFYGFTGHWRDGWVGCCCPRCQDAYREETGGRIPEEANYADPEFRRYDLWRQRDFGRFWQEIVEHLRGHNDTALVAFNNFHRLGHASGYGCPLVSTPMDSLMAAEVDCKPYQCILQMKYLRAISGQHPPENWISQQPKGPNAHPDETIYYGMLCNTAGGFMSVGLGAHPTDLRSTLARVTEVLGPRAPYVGGQPMRYAGIVVSGATKDFITQDGDPALTWRSVHGMHNLFLHAHLPSEVILDDQITSANLASFPLVVLSDVRCLGDEQARALGRYVEAGGVLLATEDTGILDDCGAPRSQGAIDALLGITARDPARPADGVVTLDGEWARDLPESFLLSQAVKSPWGESGIPGALWVGFADDVEILATTRLYNAASMEKGPRAAEQGERTAPAVVTRSVGAGRTIYINAPVATRYSHLPAVRLREMIAALATWYAVPPCRIDAMPHVAVTLWRQQDGRLFIHILSQPSWLCRLPHGHDEALLCDMATIPPSGPVALRLPWKISGVSRPITGEPVELTIVDAVSVIRIDGVGRHDVLVAETRVRELMQSGEDRDVVRRQQRVGE